ncbi:MAG: T9SS type A sorting domain-containing protein [Saprospiraceae bacterium]|nr:T9SS type A sorting domain-containing protein [Saprospiraceae bacterium]
MKLFSIFFFCSVLLASLSAQNQPVQLWQAAEYVKSMNIKGPTISLDKFQNTYMLTNQTDESPFGGFTLVKYDTLGNVLWKRHSQVGIIGILYGSFTVDSLGNAYVGQWYDGGLPGYDADAALIKYAPDGTKQWEANYGLDQSGDSYLYYSEMDTLNGRLLTLGMNLHETDPAENFLFVQAVDTSDGSVIWRTKISGVFRPQNLRIQQEHIQLLSTQYKPDSKYFVNTLVDFDGNITAQYEKPYSGYEIDFNYISRTGDVVFGNRAFGYNVTRVNIQGDTLWAYVHPLNSGTNKNWVRSVVEDDSLNVYATGSIELPGFALDMVTCKINRYGELKWEDISRSTNDEFGDGGNKVNLCKLNLLVSGFTKLENGDDVGIVRVYKHDDGSIEQDVIISSQNAYSIDNSFKSTGNLFYVGIGYQGQMPANNILALTGCFSLPKISSSTNDFEHINSINVFPNPTVEAILISDIDTNIFFKISVCDMNGKVILNKKIEAAQEKISLSNFPSGLYTVCVHGKNLQVNKKVIKI